jgi:hypothetical protein
MRQSDQAHRGGWAKHPLLPPLPAVSFLSESGREWSELLYDIQFFEVHSYWLTRIKTMRANAQMQAYENTCN